jgi:hypothetical protein
VRVVYYNGWDDEGNGRGLYIKIDKEGRSERIYKRTDKHSTRVAQIQSHACISNAIIPRSAFTSMLI